MKLKIKVKLFNSEKGITKEMPKVIKKGDWIDLSSRERITYDGLNCRNIESKNKSISSHSFLIPLGVAMQIPKGFEAIILPRSSTYKNKSIIMTNSMGVIDNTYNGDNDEWMLPALAIKKGKIEVNDRICQFRIQLSQKATVWQKIKWLFSSGIELVRVDSLNNKDRKGIGSTGV